MTTVALLLGMAQKTPCVHDDWQSNKVQYGAMCYSDVTYLYTGRGLAAGYGPYSDTGGRYSAMEYPVVIGYFAYGAALVTRALGDTPDTSGAGRGQRRPDLLPARGRGRRPPGTSG